MPTISKKKLLRMKKGQALQAARRKWKKKEASGSVEEGVEVEIKSENVLRLSPDEEETKGTVEKVSDEEEKKGTEEVSDEEEKKVTEEKVSDEEEKKGTEEVSSVKRRMHMIQEFNLELLDEDYVLGDIPTGNDYVLMQVSQLEGLIGETAKCKKCYKNKFKIERVTGNYNISTPKYALKCQSCNEVKTKRACKVKKIGEKMVSDIIARFSLASIDVGIGYQALANIFSVFNLPVPSVNQTNITVGLLLGHIEVAGENILKKCRKVVLSYYKEHLPHCIDDAGKARIAVSFDGAWKTRGHHSHIGIGFVVDIATNLIVDFHVLCNYCHRCTVNRKKLSEAEFKEWKKKHNDKNECDANFPSSLSSGSMEPEIARVVWEKSRKSELWYTTMVADGDSKSYTKVRKLAPYGDVLITKEECQNHITKRMKKALTQVAKDQRFEGEGALTDEKINAFSSFYGKAIKENVGNIKEMKNAIDASFFHHTKTPNDPIGIHSYCPDGKNSWCFVKKALHYGKEADTSKFSHPISHKVLEAIQDSSSYRELTSDNLLERCTGKTQNINESLHSRVWGLVSKETHKGVKHVKVAMWLVMVKHNLGVEQQGKLLKEFSTPQRQKLWKKAEKRRQDFKPAESKKIKKARLDNQKRKRGRSDYDPGGGD